MFVSWEPADEPSYAYLLGRYLCDACISYARRGYHIRGLSCATCERVGVRWTQSNPRNIPISHRRSVALLDEHVGPKT